MPEEKNFECGKCNETRNDSTKKGCEHMTSRLIVKTNQSIGQ